MEILENEQFNYQLTKDGLTYKLNVVCGTVGLYEISVILNSNQVENYKKEGKRYIAELAQELRGNSA